MSTQPASSDERTDAEKAIWAKFDAEIQKGLDDVEAGRLIDADVVFDEIDRKLEAMIASVSEASLY